MKPFLGLFASSSGVREGRKRAQLPLGGALCLLLVLSFSLFLREGDVFFLFVVFFLSVLFVFIMLGVRMRWQVPTQENIPRQCVVR